VAAVHHHQRHIDRSTPLVCIPRALLSSAELRIRGVYVVLDENDRLPGVLGRQAVSRLTDGLGPASALTHERLENHQPGLLRRVDSGGSPSAGDWADAELNNAAAQARIQSALST